MSLEDLQAYVIKQDGLTVSEGTLRTENLLESFCSYVEEVDPKLAEEMIKVSSKLIETDDPTLDLLDEASFILDDAYDCLNEACPEGFTFGGHPGDPACIGFWADEPDI